MGPDLPVFLIKSRRQIRRDGDLFCIDKTALADLSEAQWRQFAQPKGTSMQLNTDTGLTELLNLGLHGDVAAGDQAFAIVYAQLRRTAAAQLGPNRHATLSPTELVNEAYLKLIAGAELALNDRAHFFALSARAMRQLLIDRQRAHAMEKHGGFLQRIELDVQLQGESEPSLDYLDLDRALAALSKIDERGAKVVELHFFAGLNFIEIAELLGLSDKTVRRDWQSARAFLLLHTNADA